MQRIWRAFTLVALAAALLAGCGIGGQPAAQPDLTLQVVRWSAFPQAHYPLFDRRSRDPAVVRPFLDSFRAERLSRFTPACPDRSPASYTVTIEQRGKVVLTATLDPGSGAILFPDQEIYHPFVDAQWASLARALSVPESAMYPLAPVVLDRTLAITSLTVLVYGESASRLPDVQRTTDDVSSIRHIYLALLDMPLAHGDVFCPYDGGRGYRFTFYQGDTPVFLAYGGTGGCGYLAIGDGHRHWTLGENAFWALVNRSVGLSEDDFAQTEPGQ
jgi:hypothetical protein